MPARDGTGPNGQGSGTGKGMGNCLPNKQKSNLSAQSGKKASNGWGNRLWRGTFGRFFARRRANRINQK